MECPKCGNKMIEGFLCPGGGLRWLPKYTYGRSVSSRLPKRSGFYLTKQKLITWSEPEAWYCETCDLVVVDGANGTQSSKPTGI